MLINDFLSHLTNVESSGDNQWAADCPCPGHKHPEGHLSVSLEGDKILIKCWGKHTAEDIVKALKLQLRDLFTDNNIGDTSIGKPRYSVTPPKKQADLASKSTDKSVTPPMLQSVTGVTVQQLADVKHLSVDFLKSLGLEDFKYKGQVSVKMPYYSEDGTERAIRYRTAMSGEDRFKWSKGGHALPYGLQKLAWIRKQGWVLVEEGESDFWTAWYHKLPALGAPGKGIWPASWGEYLKGLDVYVWQEPDAQDFTLRVLAAAPDLHYIEAPDGIKDISEAHIQGLAIPELLEGLKAKAESGKALKQRLANAQMETAYQAAKHIIQSDDPLKLVVDAIKGLGYGGDLAPPEITYLSATSRLLDMREGAMPVHLLVMGQSSSGKNYTVSRVVKLLPPESYHVIDAGSPRVLIYDDADLQHKVLIFTEADSLPAGEDNPAASAIRNLLQDHHLHYAVPIRDPETGDFIVREVDKPGPTTLITTSTKSLGHQMMTRLFTLGIADSQEQISLRLKAQAALETEGSIEPDVGIIAYQAYLQLKAPIRVLVPFAKELGAAMAKMAAAPRILRDFAKLISLIKSSAIIRHYHRQTDSKGRIVATLEDYETVRELVNDMYIESSTGATDAVRNLVEAVGELNKERGAGERITVTRLANHLGINKMAASRRARKAVYEGWLINQETRKGYQADYSPGETMPKVEGLPTLVDLNTVTDRNTPLVTVSSLKKGDCNTVTPLTDGNTTYPTELCPKCGQDAWALSPDNHYYCTSPECEDAP